MILEIISAIASIGVVYNYHSPAVGRIVRAVAPLPYSMTVRHFLVGIAEFLGVAAVSTTIYGTLWLIGLQRLTSLAIALLPIYTLLLYLRIVPPFQANAAWLRAVQRKWAPVFLVVVLIWAVVNNFLEVLVSDPYILGQLVAATAAGLVSARTGLAYADWVTLNRDDLHTVQRRSLTVVQRIVMAAIFLATAVSVYRASLYAIDYVTHDFQSGPAWFVFTLLIELVALEGIRRIPHLKAVQGRSRALLEFTTIVGAGYLLDAMWYWPLQVFAAALALGYTYLMVRNTTQWTSPHETFAFRVAAFGIIYLFTQLAVVTIYKFPILLAPVPFRTLLHPAKRPLDNESSACKVKPTLEELRRAHEHHRANCTDKAVTLQEQIGRRSDSLAATVIVPGGHEETWHRHAVNYYRELLQEEYFLDLPLVESKKKQEENARMAFRNVMLHIRYNGRHLRKNLKQVGETCNQDGRELRAIQNDMVRAQILATLEKVSAHADADDYNAEGQE
jgi:hypothetical protein